MSRSDAVQFTLTLPDEEEIEHAVEHADLVSLLALDRQIRDAWPTGMEVGQDVALKAVDLLGRIQRALETITLADSPYRRHAEGRPRPARAADTRSPAQRTEAVRKALKVAQEGRPDIEAAARAAQLRARWRQP